MYKYIKSSLLVFICIASSQNNAQPPFSMTFDGKYTITIGNKRITPPQNVHAFSTLKKELAQNFYEDSYHVLIQFNDEPNVDLQSQMTGKIFNELTVSKNTYVASVNKDINKRILKKLDVRAILALSPEMKISPSIAQSNEEFIDINVVTPKSMDENIILNELKRHDAAFKLKFMADSVNKYTYSIKRSKLNTLAQLPWVLQIDEGGMR